MNKKTIPLYEIELIIAHILKKSREYVLTHPELKLTKAQVWRFQNLVNRRKKHEPLAYILGHKEFYGLDFKVNKHTLIPRPETELLVDLTTSNLQLDTIKHKNTSVIDVGTGSGNIIISIAHNTKHITRNCINFLGIDISEKALRIARQNAKAHHVDKKIKFIKGDLLEHLVKNKKLKIKNLIILANLPYLSKKIYSSTIPDVKNFEPKSALLSGTHGLDHYAKLLQQINCLVGHRPLFTVHCFMEISPEQKTKFKKLARKCFPGAELTFHKDLARKWRVAEIKL